MPESRLKQGFSAVSEHKRTPLQSNSAAGFVFFARIVAFCSVVIVKPPSSDNILYEKIGDEVHHYKCLWLYKLKIKFHHSSARSAINLTSLTASAS